MKDVGKTWPADRTGARIAMIGVGQNDRPAMISSQSRLSLSVDGTVLQHGRSTPAMAGMGLRCAQRDDSESYRLVWGPRRK